MRMDGSAEDMAGRPGSRPGDRLAMPVIAAVSAVVVLVVAVLLLAGPRSGAVPGAVSALPAVNAFLNGVSAGLLAIGYAMIRGRRIRAHMTCMVLAFGVSVLFLVSYVTYHALAGSRPFTGQGWLRRVYFPLLISHIVLAAVIVPFALTTLYRGLRGDFGRHVRIARWTLPLWLYVSVTGVLVYLMLYQLS